MKAKKLRGHRRIFKNIAHWKNRNLQLEVAHLERYQRKYVKVWVRPFSDISITGKSIAKPKRKSRRLVIESLLEIFNSWETQLKTRNKPYYLAIWLFEPNIEYSQVVCAVDDFLHFYDISFYRPEEQREMPTQNYGTLKAALDSFNWIEAKDDNYFTNEDVALTEDSYYSIEEYSAQQKWYRQKLKQPLRNSKDLAGKITYYIPKDTVWIGTKN